MNPVHIRSMQPNEFDAIVALEAASSPHPFSKAKIQSEMELSHARILVAVSGSEVLGYLDYWTVDNELHIINLTVATAHRRKKIASGLLEAMLKMHPEARSCYLEVRPSNQPALSLYGHMGFKPIHKRKKYYSDGEDAIVMERKS